MMLKPSILISILIFFFFGAQSQITKGNWLVGGNFSYQHSKSSGLDAIIDNNNSARINTNLGNFIIDKFAAGVILRSTFSRHNYKFSDGTSRISKETTYGIGPFARFYFFPTERTINLLVEASGVYGVYIGKSNPGSKNIHNSLEYGVYAGPVLYFNSAVGIELLGGFTSTKTYNLDSKFQVLEIKIGFQFYLERE